MSGLSRQQQSHERASQNKGLTAQQQPPHALSLC
jgi:hypothetical protein